MTNPEKQTEAEQTTLTEAPATPEEITSAEAPSEPEQAIEIDESEKLPEKTVSESQQDNDAEIFRSGVVAVIGRPNVGKSTLINEIVEQKIAIISPKPQTTRKRQLGILTDEDGRGQILFVDTPGMHKTRNKLDEYMMAAAQSALRDADVIMWIIDATNPPGKPEFHIAETLKGLNDAIPILIILNKIDLLKGFQDFREHLGLIKHKTDIKLSALTGENVDDLIDLLFSMLPEGPQYYPEDQVSDVNMRFLTSELIREKVLLHTRQEVPHSVAVEVTNYEEREDIHHIDAVIYVERDSQKGIIIGHGGKMIKQIGSEARQELEEMVESKVFMDVRVKVMKNWRADERFMKRIGYQHPRKDK
ncbi:MAG: GTPase Era [Aggregatilineales bacterium]